MSKDLSIRKEDVQFSIEQVRTKIAEVSEEKDWHRLVGLLSQIKIMRVAVEELMKKADDARIALLELEISTYIRLKEIGATKKIPASLKKAVDFAQEDRERFSKLIAEYTTSKTILSVYRSYNQDTYVAEDRAVMQGIMNGNGINADSEYGKWVYKRSAVEDIVRSFVLAGEPFSVGDMLTEYHKWDEGLDLDDEGTRKIVQEALRKAVMDTRTVTIEEIDLPRFVTFSSSVGWVRLPVEKATITHLDSMIALREKQLLEDSEALKRLKKAKTKIEKIAHYSFYHNKSSEGYETKSEEEAYSKITIGELIFDYMSSGDKIDPETGKERSV